jgi:hypothetical protein
VDADTATQMGIFRFDRDGEIVAFEEKPKMPRLAEIGRSIPPGATFGEHMRRAAVHGLDGLSTSSQRESCSTCSSTSRDTTSAAS